MAIPSARRVLGTAVEFAADPKSAIDGADCCIIMTEWDEFRCLKGKDYAERMRKANVVDARRFYRRGRLDGVDMLAFRAGGVSWGRVFLAAAPEMCPGWGPRAGSPVGGCVSPPAAPHPTP